MDISRKKSRLHLLEEREARSSQRAFKLECSQMLVEMMSGPMQVKNNICTSLKEDCNNVVAESYHKEKVCCKAGDYVPCEEVGVE